MLKIPLLLITLLTLITPLKLAAHGDHSHAQHEEHEEHHEEHEQPLQHGTHEHGSAHIDIVVEANTLVLVLRLPGMDAVGFEHLPTTTAQQEAVAQVKAQLAHSAEIFIPSAAAQCHATDTQVHTHGLDSAHTEFSVEAQFQCEQPTHLKDVRFNVFSLFPALEKIQVQSVSVSGQHAVLLKRAHEPLIHLP
jgi:hypothetical protein